jgi:hypothetical protein
LSLRRRRYLCDRRRIGYRRNLRPLTKLVAPEQLTSVDPDCMRNLGGNGAGLHCRGNNLFLLACVQRRRRYTDVIVSMACA